MFNAELACGEDLDVKLFPGMKAIVKSLAHEAGSARLNNYPADVRLRLSRGVGIGVEEKGRVHDHVDIKNHVI